MKTYIRKCSKCKEDVEVKPHHTTVICNACKEKLGFRPKQLDHDTDDFVFCRICKEARRRTDLHIVKVHKMSIDEYLKMYPGALIYSKNLTKKKNSRDVKSRQKTSVKIKKSWQNEETRKKHAMHPNGFAGKHHSIETKMKLSKSSDYRKSIKGQRKDINCHVRSMIEANMCRMLDYCGVKYYYEKPFVLENNILLLVDFELFDDFEFIKKGYLELKGWINKAGHFSNKEKFDQLQKLYPEEYKKLTFLFPDSDEWRSLEEKYSKILPMWETGKYNLFTHPEIFSINRVNEKELLTEFLICPLCMNEGRGLIQSRVKSINFAHLSQHKITMKKFRKEFPDQKLKIDSIGEQHSKSLSGKNHFNYGKKMSDEVRQHLCEGQQNGAKKRYNDPNFYKECLDCGKKTKVKNGDLCSKCKNKVYIEEDTDELVYCRVCHLAGENLSRHIVDEHEMTVKEYKKLYGNCVCSIKFGEKTASTHFKTMSAEHKKAIGLRAKEKLKLRLEWENTFKIEDYQKLIESSLTLQDSAKYIYCRICRKRMKKISENHLFSHKMTGSMYKRLFPDAPLTLSKNRRLGKRK